MFLTIVNFFGTYLFPCFLFLVIAWSAFSKNDAIGSFKVGAKTSMSAIIDIVPNIMAIMVAVALFTKTGALDYFVTIMTPLLNFFNIPTGLCELILVRPISGSSAIVLLSNIYEKFGADSYEGLIASVVAASTETTLYTIMVYFGVTKVKKNLIPLTAGLLADVFTLLFSIFIIKIMFF